MTVEENNEKSNKDFSGFKVSVKKSKKQAIAKAIKSKMLNAKCSQDHKSRVVKSWNCRNFLKITDSKKDNIIVDRYIETRTCKKKFCLNCSAIRSMKEINRIYPVIKKTFKNPFHVVLTVPTIQCKTHRDLSTAIELRNNTWKILRINIKKQFKTNITGFKITEITYRPDNYYHIHYHLIVDGEEEAKSIVDYWLRLNPNANEKAQFCGAFNHNENAIIEVMKYVTKFYVRNSKGKPSLADGDKANFIFEALHRKHTLALFGKLRIDVREYNKNKKEEPIIDFDSKESEIYYWLDGYFNWYKSLDSLEEPINDFKPTKKFLDFVES
jgi:hypothetical protein